MVSMTKRFTSFFVIMILMISSIIIIIPNNVSGDVSFVFFDDMEGSFATKWDVSLGTPSFSTSMANSINGIQSLKMDTTDSTTAKDFGGASVSESFLQFFFYPESFNTGETDNWDIRLRTAADGHLAVIKSFGTEIKCLISGGSYVTIGNYIPYSWNSIRVHMYDNYQHFIISLNNGNWSSEKTNNPDYDTPTYIHITANLWNNVAITYFDDIMLSNDGFLDYPFHHITATMLYSSCGWMDINTIGGEWNWIRNNLTPMMSGKPIEIEIFDTDNTSIGQLSSYSGTEGTWINIYIMDAIRTHHGGIPNYGQYNVSVIGDLTEIGYGYSNTVWLHFTITNIIPTSLTASLSPPTVYYSSTTILSGSWIYSSNSSQVVSQPVEISIYNQSGILIQTFSTNSLPYGGWISYDVMLIIRTYWNDSTLALGSYQISCIGLLSYSNSSNYANVTLTIIATASETNTLGFSAIIWLLVSLFPALILSTKFEKYGYTIGLLLMVIILGFAQSGYMFVTIIALIGIGITWWKG